nr:hypothetical protein [Tanacetum cinerariifolium]
MKDKPGHVRPESGFYAKINAIKFVPQMILSREQAYWLNSQDHTPSKPVTPFVRKEKDICSIVLSSNLVVPLSLDSLDCTLAELRTNCDREHSKVLELEAEVLKRQHMLTESEKRCAFLENKHENLQLKFQKYKECLQSQKRCDSSNYTASNAIFEINKLRDQLQGKDETIRNLQAQHNIVSLLNVGPTDGRKALETELTQLKDTITALRIRNDGFKVTNATQKTEIAKLKPKDDGNKSSGTTTPTNPKVLALGMYAIGPNGTTTPTNPKVLAPGMYAIGPKYIIPHRRTNRETPIPMSKKKHVTFKEPPKPSPTVTKKPIAPQVKKANVAVHLKLPAKSTSREKVEDQPRNLNKQNRVDSHLNVKRLVSISNLNAICGAFHECVFSFNHDKCVVYSINFVKPKATPNRQTTKKVWKQKVVAHAKPQWMPTRWHFTLYDSYPLTRILDPIEEP